jgi:hypothetical protein
LRQEQFVDSTHRYSLPHRHGIVGVDSGRRIRLAEVLEFSIRESYQSPRDNPRNPLISGHHAVLGGPTRVHIPTYQSPQVRDYPQGRFGAHFQCGDGVRTRQAWGTRQRAPGRVTELGHATIAGPQAPLVYAGRPRSLSIFLSELQLVPLALL